MDNVYNNKKSSQKLALILKKTTTTFATISFLLFLIIFNYSNVNFIAKKLEKTLHSRFLHFSIVSRRLTLQKARFEGKKVESGAL